MPRFDLTDTCTSAEDGRLLRVADVAAALKKLKADPSKVLVAAIAGPPTPYVVGSAPPGLPDAAPWPVVAHSCTQREPDGAVTTGDPAVRVAEWVRAFGGNGVFQPICADNFRPALTALAYQAADRIEDGCVAGKVLDTSGALWTGATAPDCNVTDHAYGPEGVAVDAVLPACLPGQNAGPTPCWYLTAAQGCPGGPAVRFNRPGRHSVDLNTTVSCSVRVCPPKGTPGAPRRLLTARLAPPRPCGGLPEALHILRGLRRRVHGRLPLRRDPVSRARGPREAGHVV